MEKIYYVIIGWFLGILNIFLVEQYKRYLCGKSFKTAKNKRGSGLAMTYFSAMIACC